MVHLKFNLTEEEYFQFTYHSTWTAPGRRKYRLLYYGKVFLLYAAVAILYIVTRHSNQLLIDFTIFGTVGLVYFLLIPYLVRKSLRRRVREIVSSKENEHILDESEVIISEAGIIDRDKVSESRYDWDAIVKKAETSSSYYLYTNSYHAVVIPKRALKSDAEREKLRQLLHTNLSLSSEFA